MIDLVHELCSYVGISTDYLTRLHVKIHEDNVGTLALGHLEPCRMTPQSKHYALKYHWFHEHIGPQQIEICKVSSDLQIGDMFTKGLGHVEFERFCLLLTGW